MTRLDSDCIELFLEQGIKEHCSRVKLFLQGIEKIRPTYGIISQENDYTGLVNVEWPNGENYEFSFRIWHAFTRKIIDSKGKSRDTPWFLVTLQALKTHQQAEEFKKIHRFALTCAIIEAVEEAVEKHIARDARP